MPDATVASNRERIVWVEDDVSNLESRVSALEIMHVEHMAKLDILIKMGRAIMAVAAATLGLELGIEDNKESNGVIHRGIAKRYFSKVFTIADDVEINGAELKDGLLKVSLNKILPEGKQPKSIEVK